MITLTQFRDIVADSVFGGDVTVTGLVIFTAILAIIFILMKRNIFASLVLAIPAAFVCSILGLLTTDMLMILVVICVLGLAMTSKKTFGE